MMMDALVEAERQKEDAHMEERKKKHDANKGVAPDKDLDEAVRQGEISTAQMPFDELIRRSKRIAVVPKVDPDTDKDLTNYL